MKRIVHYSGGLCSFQAAKRVKERYGPEDMVLLFADTCAESDDLYQFVADTSSYLGISITRISREMTPWELFRKEGMIGNSRSPICSVMLKRELLDGWRVVNCEPDSTTVYVGFDPLEFDRLDDLRTQIAPWQVEAPMCNSSWGPLWNKCEMAEQTEKLGIKVSARYKQGFSHDNCNAECVRAGITHWVNLYRIDRPAFDHSEHEEQRTIAEFKQRGISTEWATILKDRRGGVAKAMTLTTLRSRVEAGEKMPLHEWGGCGCGTTN